MNIKDKINKMLELARRGGTEAEAETAMRMVLQALAKHNLDMSDVEETEEKDEDIIEDITDGGKSMWQHFIWISLSKLYFCKMYTQKYKKNGKIYKSFVLIGRKSNVDTAKSVIKYLIELGTELASDGDTIYRNSFKNGYAARIFHRCEDEKKRATDLTQIEYTSLAPAIINLYEVTTIENNKFLEDKGVKLDNRKIGIGALHPPAVS